MQNNNMHLIDKKQRNELKKFIKNNNFNKIFILTGKNSYYKSGASKIFEILLFKKKNKFFF